MTSVPNTLLIDGHDLRSYFTGVTVIGEMNLYAPGRRKGDDVDYPGSRGSVGAPGLQLAAYQFAITVRIDGTTRGDRDHNHHQLGQGLKGANSDGLVVLTRRLMKADDSTYEEFTADGRFVDGLAMQLYNHLSGRCDLQFVNLDGAWLRTSDSAWIIP